MVSTPIMPPRRRPRMNSAIPIFYNCKFLINITKEDLTKPLECSIIIELYRKYLRQWELLA